MKKNSIPQQNGSVLLSGISLLLVAACGGIFLVIPFFQALLISMKDYSVVRGVFGSPWVGLENFRALFASPTAAQIIRNSLVLGLLGGIPPVLAGGALGFVLCRRAAGRKSAILLACWLLPLFLPEILCVFLILPLGFEVFSSPSLSRLVYLLISGLRIFCLTVFLSGICGLVGKERGRSAGKSSFLGASAVFALVSARAFSSSPMLELFQNPLNYEKTETLDTYCYRTGLMGGAFSSSAAVWVVKWLLQLPFLAVGAVLLVVLMKKCAGKAPAASGKSNSVPALAGGVIALGATLAFGIALLAVQDGVLPAEVWLMPLGGSLLVTVLSGVLFAVVFGLFWLSCYRLSAVSACLGLLLVSLLGNTVAFYLFYRQLYLFNTFLGPALWACCNGALLFAPMAAVGSFFRGESTPVSRWLRQTAPFFLLFGGLFLASVWGSWREQVILCNDRQRYTLFLVIREWMISGMGAQYAESGASVGLVNVLLVALLVPLLVGAVSIALFGLLYPKDGGER